MGDVRALLAFPTLSYRKGRPCSDHKRASVPPVPACGSAALKEALGAGPSAASSACLPGSALQRAGHIHLHPRVTWCQSPGSSVLGAQRRGWTSEEVERRREKRGREGSGGGSEVGGVI